MARAVLVVELRLGHGVVDVDAGELELAGLHHLVETVHARGGLLGHATDVRGHAGEVGVVTLEAVAKRLQDDTPLFWIVVLVELGDDAGRFELAALVDEHRGIATVVEDQIAETFVVRPAERLLGAPPVLLERLALPGVDRGAGGVIGGAV